MKLRLSITKGQQASSGLTSSSYEFSEAGGTIGRSVRSDWVLEDPTRVISGIHAEISFADDHFVITDRSTNGVYLNGSEISLGAGNSQSLQGGDRIAIGELEILTEIVAEEATPEQSLGPWPFSGEPEHRPMVLPEDFVPEIPGFTSPEMDRVADIATNLDDIGDIRPELEGNGADLGMGSAAGAIPPGYFEKIPEDWQKPSPDETPPPSQAPEDWPKPASDEAPASQPVEAEDLTPSSQLAAQASEPSGETRVGPISQPAPPVEPPSEHLQPEQPEPPTPPQVEPRPLTGAAPPHPKEPAYPHPSRSAPTIPGGTAPTTGPQPAAAAPEGGDLSQALDALLAGAGVPSLKVAGGASPQVFRAIGELLALYAAGTTELLRTIGEIKNTFRINQTQVQQSDNNPLRWAVTPHEAIKRLLAPEEDGYLPPREAVVDAIASIKAHQIGTIRGMEAALKQFLNEQEPAELERGFERQGRPGMLTNKGAWYWQQYAVYHRRLSENAHDNVLELVGTAFSAAYEQQVRRIRNQQR